MTRRTLCATALTTVALVAPAAAAADTVSADTYRTTYDLEITYDHQQRYEAATSADVLRVALRGRGPDVHFEDGELLAHANSLAKDLPVGEAQIASSLDNPDGDSFSCTGNLATAAGGFGIGSIKGKDTAIWFAPAVAVTGYTRCDGGHDPGELRVGPARPVDYSADAVPVHGARLPVTKAQATSAGFTMPFEVTATDVRCPNFETISTTSCMATWRGTIRFERIKHEDTGILDRPVEITAPPKANGTGKRVETTVQCRRRCAVELMIGVFGQRDGKPHVTPVTRVRRGARPGRPTTVRATLSAADRRRLSGGLAMAVVTVRPKGGKPVKAPFPLR